MANLFNTRLECPTNKELLRIIDPNKIINKTRSEFRFSLVDELVFETRSCTMHEDIVDLSDKFPREIFMVRYYDLCSRLDSDSPGLYVRYEKGKSTFLGYEPQYEWINHEQIIKDFGEEVFYRLHRRIRQYLLRLDYTKKSILTEELECDILEHHFDNCVTSYATIYAEYENFKVSVDKTRNSELTFRGFRRNSPSEEWVELPVDSKNAKTNEKQND